MNTKTEIKKASKDFPREFGFIKKIARALNAEVEFEKHSDVMFFLKPLSATSPNACLQFKVDEEFHCPWVIFSLREKVPSFLDALRTTEEIYVLDEPSPKKIANPFFGLSGAALSIKVDLILDA